VAALRRAPFPAVISMTISDRHRRLAHEDARFRLLTEQSSDMLSRHTPDGVYRYASPAATSLLGYTPEELIGRPVFELLHPDELDEARALHEEIHRSNGTVTLTHRVRGKDGRYLWFECNTRAVRDPISGEVVEIHAVARDITKRKEAEEALRESEDQFRTLLENLDVGIVVQGPRSEVLLANPAALTLLGLTEEELLGKTAFDSGWRAIREDGTQLPPEMHPSVLALRTGRPVRDAVVGMSRGADDGLVWLLTNATPQIGPGGEVRQVIISFRDITARRTAEREREVLIEELQKALAGIKALRGLLPICANCKKIRDDQGYWEQIEVYIKAHSDADFSHALCPDCAVLLFGEYLED
jgi:PAS domain S-box-containing protein